VPTGVDAARLDTSRTQGWSPVPKIERAELEVVAVLHGGDEPGEPTRMLVEYLEHLLP
jgi:hypothetical protein